MPRFSFSAASASMATPLDRVLSGLAIASALQATSAPTSPAAGADAAPFWEALERSKSFSASPGGRLPTLPTAAAIHRSRSVCVAKQLRAGGTDRSAGSTHKHDRLPPLGRAGSVSSAPCAGPGQSLQPVNSAAEELAPASSSPAAGSNRQAEPGSSSGGGSPCRAPCAGSRPLSPTPLAELCSGVSGLALSGSAGGEGDAAEGGAGTAASAEGEQKEKEEALLTARCGLASEGGQAWKSLDQFSSLRLIGTGRSSTVWEAAPKAAASSSSCSAGGAGASSKQLQHPPTVVVKACCPASMGRHALRRLLLEQRILQTVSHAHIIRGLGSFQEDGLTYLVMEHAGGPSILQSIEQRRRRRQDDFEQAGSDSPVVPEAEAAATVVAPLLDALAHLHSRGFVHRDVKAANAVFTRSGAVKLIDFGLALDTSGSGEELPCCQVGTLAYMAPELLGDEPPKLALADRTDCWAVGVLAFQLLAGKLPWFHEVKGLLHHLVAEAAVPFEVLDGVGASLPAQAFIRSALTKEPSHRPTAAQLRAHPWLLQHSGGRPLAPSEFAA